MDAKNRAASVAGSEDKGFIAVLAPIGAPFGSWRLDTAIAALGTRSFGRQEPLQAFPRAARSEEQAPHLSL